MLKGTRVNMHTKKVIILLVLGIIVFLISDSVFALGVTPGRKTLQFEHKDISGSFTIINNDPDPITVLLSADVFPVSFNAKEVFLDSGESREVSYTIHLPQSLSSGTHQVNMMATPKDFGGESVHSLPAVTSQVMINVPSQEKSAQATLDMKISEGGDEAIFFVAIENRGTAIIHTVDTYIEIANNTSLLQTLKGSTVEIESLQRKDMQLHWTTPLIGIISTTTNIFYDNQKISLYNNFTIEELFLQFVGLKITDYEEDVKVNLEIELKNSGKNDLQGVTCTIRLYQTDIKAFSSPVSIDSGTSKSCKIVFPLGEVHQPVPIGVLEINYGSGLITKEISMKINKDTIHIIINGQDLSFEKTRFASQEIVDAVSGVALPITIILAIIIIIIININITLYYLRKRKPSQKIDPTVSDKIILTPSINREVAEFIQKERAKGVNDLHLYEVLSDSGLPDEEIRRVLDIPKDKPEKSKPRKKSRVKKKR